MLTNNAAGSENKKKIKKSSVSWFWVCQQSFNGEAKDTSVFHWLFLKFSTLWVKNIIII